MNKLLSFFISILSFVFPALASAHEVYVLDHAEIAQALATPPPDLLGEIVSHLGQFTLWGLMIIGLIVLIFFISTNTALEQKLDPMLYKLKTWAPRIAQITLGFAILASGYYNALFGPELPLPEIFGHLAGIVQIVLFVSGIMLILGVYPRIAGFITLSICIAMFAEKGIYMLNYGTYVGESLTMAFLGSGYIMLGNHKSLPILSRLITPKVRHYKFLVMRILFGVSLIYASLYAKLIHGGLALDTVLKYNLTDYFHFDPLFIVLGAMLLEILIGLCYIIGFEIRFVSLVFLTFLTLSISFFGEAVWPHIILVGTAVAMFAHGYDSYSLSWFLSKKRKNNKNLEPIL